jgi:hypothetical protein
MARLWKVVNGEPYMINPRLGVLALQALNPKRRTMARKHGARHMAWVRSFRRKGNRSHHKKHRRHNPYPMAGTVAALANRRRHRKHNPGGVGGFLRGGIGLPPVMTILWSGAGFIATAAIQGFIDTLVPVSWKTNTDGSPNLMTKYGEIAASIIAVSWGGKQFVGPGPGSLMGIGGSVYAMQQAAHDFMQGVIPGMHSYTPLKSYTPLHPSSTMGNGIRGVIESAGGSFPRLAGRDTMMNLAAPDYGFRNNANFADDGGMNIIQQRFQRFA